MAALQSVAIRVKEMEAMLAFYSEAFGAEFKRVEVQGLACQFGAVGNIMLKLVPLREKVDFEGYPLHQLGFEVADLTTVLASAERNDGRVESDISGDGDKQQAVVRDPDGNTLELSAPNQSGFVGR